MCDEKSYCKLYSKKNQKKFNKNFLRKATHVLKIFDLCEKSFYYLVAGGAVAVPQLSSAPKHPSTPRSFKKRGGRRVPACHGARGGVDRKSDSFLRICNIERGFPFFHGEGDRGGVEGRGSFLSIFCGYREDSGQEYCGKSIIRLLRISFIVWR
ncbi:hypothetical protein CDAR_434251 [Caerostris darwini]|uniref:Uncharacterized protein n=1 Tax=Caerostris darwini TaxID=1538125 RepID=A0AAV4UA83_9ARAC|nr:hypothetical protein CDAR_434251 [Caerostris darwini]